MELNSMKYQEVGMKLLDTAIEMEREGAAFYDALTLEAEDDGLKKICSILADDERRHERIFRALRDGVAGDEVALDPLEAETLLSALDPDAFRETDSQKELYERALEIELKSIEFYTEGLETLDRKEDAVIVKRIIREERRHYDILDTIIMMLNRPDRWVENAEFGNREEY